MGRVVITEFMDGAAIDLLRASHDVLYQPDLASDELGLAAALADADALIVRNRTRVTSQILDAGPHLRVIGRLGVGLDNIDLDACALRSVAVCPATGANAVAVAEYVIGASLTLIRGVFGATEAVLAGGWPRQELTGLEMSGRTLGLVGYGSIAREVGHRASALGMQVLAFDPHLPHDVVWDPAVPSDWEGMLARSEIVSVHVPLLPETHHLIDTAAIALMPVGSVVINTSRGGVVDETAVVTALRSGHLGGAALDVFETEPPTPERLAEFDSTPNLLLTPHVAGVTRESNVRVSHVVAQAVLEELSHD